MSEQQSTAIGVFIICSIIWFVKNFIHLFPYINYHMRIKRFTWKKWQGFGEFVKENWDVYDEIMFVFYIIFTAIFIGHYIGNNLLTITFV